MCNCTLGSVGLDVGSNFSLDGGSALATTSTTATTTTTTAQSCGNELTWPDLDHDLVCGDCKVLVDNMDTKYFTCDSYCSAIGRKCTGAWEESSDNCTVKSIEDCQHNFNYTSDSICECGEGDFHI